MSEINGSVIQLFPSPFGIYDLGGELELHERAILESVDMRFTESGGAALTGVSASLGVLDEFEEAGQALLRRVDHYKNSVLGYPDIKLSFTTSWVAATAPGGFSQAHCHRNSVISGVYYFTGQRDISPIIFERDMPALWLGEPASYNQFNCGEQAIVPRPGGLILFPSHIRHRVGVNQSSSIRYSLAFNLFPNSRFGGQDSSVLTG